MSVNFVYDTQKHLHNLDETPDNVVQIFFDLENHHYFLLL